MKRHYYMTHPVHGRLVTIDPQEVEFNKAQGWTLEEEAQPQEQPKRGPGRPRKVSNEHDGAADH